MKTGATYPAMWFVLAAALFAASSCAADRAEPVVQAVDASAGAPASPAASPALMAAARSALVRDALGLREHAGTWTAANAAQGFSTSIDGSGATLSKLGAGGAAPWRVALHVARIGRAQAMRDVGTATPGAAGARVTIDRAAGVTEWFEHDARGLEHGADLEARPAGDGELVLEVAVTGLTPKLADGGTSVELLDAAGDRTLTYGELAVHDADGRSVAARMTVEGSTIAIAMLDAAARYPLEVDPLVWGVQETELLPSDGTASDAFGWSVAISGTTAVVGASSKTFGTSSYQGSAYVFVQSGTTWTQQAELAASDGAANDHFGSSVSVSGSTAIVGAPDKTIGANADQGAAYVFVRNGASWTQQAELTASDGAANDYFGRSVSIGGTTAIAGTSRAAGAAYVFVQGGTTWTEQQKLAPADPAFGDGFGYSVSVSGSMAVVGANNKTVGSNAAQGAAYVFVQNGTTWTQQQKLVASDGTTNDDFGYTVSMAGPAAIVGAPYKTAGSNTNQGAAYVFVQSGTTWTEQQKLVASDGATNDHLGLGVSISGTTAIVGAYSKAVGANANQGVAYAFVQSGSTWAQQAELVATDGAASDLFGLGVAISGTTAVVGAFGKTVGSNAGQGAAYVFVPGHTNGDPCTAPLDCVSGFCVDGVCCNTACGGGVATDCQACSVAAGGALDGSCSASSAAFVCHTANGACDNASLCDGTTLTCPAETYKPATTQCLAPTGPCDNGARCTGSAAACPADTFSPSGTICAAPTACLQAASCTGSAGTCPAQAQVPDGTPCTAGTCRGGTCVMTADAGLSDGGATDSGIIDSGTPDSGGTGEGGADSGTHDSGMIADSGGSATDSGAAIDSSTATDSGTAIDSSTATDAVAPQADGAASGDAAEEEGGSSAGPSGNNGGCGCVTAGTTSPSARALSLCAFALPLVVVFRRRRRDRRVLGRPLTREERARAAAPSRA